MLLLFALFSCNENLLNEEINSDLKLGEVNLIESSIYENGIKLMELEIYNNADDTIYIEDFIRFRISIKSKMDTSLFSSLVILDNNINNLFVHIRGIASPGPPLILFTDSAYKFSEYYNSYLKENVSIMQKTKDGRNLVVLVPNKMTSLRVIFYFLDEELNLIELSKLINNNIKGFFVFNVKYFKDKYLKKPVTQIVISDTSNLYLRILKQ